MGIPPPKWSLAGTISALLVTGFGIGWLAGLSVSPVVSIVITSVTGSIAAIVAALSGVKADGSVSKERIRLPNIAVWPLSVLIVGILIGSTLGILARNRQSLGSDISSEIEKWKAIGVPKEVIIEKLLGTTNHYSPYTEPYTQTFQTEIDSWVSLGIPKEQVVARLFEQHFSASKASPTETTPTLKPDNRVGTYLFATDSAECISLLAKLTMAEKTSNNKELEDALRNSTVTQLRILPDIITDFEVLKVLVGQVLCANG